MKARVVKTENDILVLHYDGTISISSSDLLKRFLCDFADYSSFSGKNGKWTDVTFDMGDFPGTTLAYVTDSGQLVVNDANFFADIFKTIPSLTDYLTVEEYAKLHNRSVQMIRAYAMSGRIPGVTYFGYLLAIPKDAPYPVSDKARKPNSGLKPKD